MLGNLSKLMDSAKELNWEKLVILVLFLAILLSGYYGYRKISSINFQATQVQKKVTESQQGFIKQFGSDYVSIDANIHRYLVNLRSKADADWVLFFGIHNGQNIGPYHLKKVSVIDEAVDIGNRPLYQRIQNIPMTLFSSTYPTYVDKDTTIVRHAPEAKRGAMAELIRNGIHFEISTGIYIEQHSIPIGFIGLFYKKSRAEKLRKDKDLIELNRAHLIKAKDFVEYELNRLYLMGDDNG